MHSIKTPDSCFQNLQNFPYLPNYQTIDDGDGGELTMHYVEEGPPDGPLNLCAHGQPVWSYSVRKMIPPLTDAGYRVVVPDIIGFGRSEKTDSYQNVDISLGLTSEKWGVTLYGENMLDNDNITYTFPTYF